MERAMPGHFRVFPAGAGATRASVKPDRPAQRMDTREAGPGMENLLPIRKVFRPLRRRCASASTPHGTQNSLQLGQILVPPA